MNLNEIFNNKEKSDYYIHRFSISPLFINFNGGKNNMPVLLSIDEYSLLEDDENVFLLPFDFWTREDNEDEKYEIEFLKSNGISKEKYDEITKINFEKQLKKYFDRGLYVVETSIERTATSLKDDPEIEFSRLAQNANFSFNAGNNFLGTLANRTDELNVVIILEIPKECTEATLPLFERVKETLTIPTTYRGVIDLDTVIPRQYIKGAVVKTKDGYIYYNNGEYNPDYRIKEGKLDDIILNKLIDKTSKGDFDYDAVLSTFEAIDMDYRFNKDVFSFISRMRLLIDLMQEKAEKTDKNRKLYYTIAERIEEVRRSIMTPLEVEVENLDLSTLNESELTEKAKNILLQGRRTMTEERNKYAIGFDKRLSIFIETLSEFNETIMSRISDKKLVEEILVRREQILNLSRLSYELIWIETEFQCGKSEDVDLKKRYQEAKEEYETVYDSLSKDYKGREI